MIQEPGVKDARSDISGDRQKITGTSWKIAGATRNILLLSGFNQVLVIN